MESKYDMQMMVQAARMYYLEGLTQQSIAKELGISRTDEAMHRQLMDIQGHPCLSILFEKKMDTADACDYDMRMFLLDQKGRHQEVTFNLTDLK